MKSVAKFPLVVMLFAVLASLHTVSARNVILLIGDGMGFEHVQAGRLYVTGSDAGELSFETLPFHAQAITTLPSGAATDSATAGTALATGYQHPSNGTISTDASGNPVTTILELAKAKGWRVGIVTTDDIAGATPGSFGAHEPDRNLMADIRNDYLVNDSNHAASLPNILFGGGASDTYSALAASVGYTVVRTDQELAGLDMLVEPRVLGQFAAGILTREKDRLPNNTEPRLAQMVTRALGHLSQESTGFFLVVEGALIDKLSHDNSLEDLCPEVEQFHLAVQAALDWAGEDPETLILVTADHETGGLEVPDQQSIEPGTQPAFSWSSTGHTTRDVPLYASWPASLEGTRVDNTETFFIMEDWIENGAPPVIASFEVGNVRQTSASVTWVTREPSSGFIECKQGGVVISSDSDLARVNYHGFGLDGLVPDTDYEVVVSSKDLAGYTGTASITFRSASLDVDAYVLAEPAIILGSVAGTGDALAMAGDGLVQTISELPLDIGLGLEVIYTLHTAAAVNSISGLTLNTAYSWTDRDRGNDGVELWVYNGSGDAGWEPLAVNADGSFPLVPPQAYVDTAGDILVRFTDISLILREKKDTLTIDWLQADVEAGPPDLEAPSTPQGLAAVAPEGTELTAELSWSANSEEDLGGYFLRRVDSFGTPVSGETSVAAPPFTDRVMAAGNYYYQVAAIDLSGNRSDWSASAEIRLENTRPPSVPTGLQAVGGDGMVTLTWEARPEWDVAGYNVYFYDEGQSKYRILDDGLTGLSYQHAALENGRVYEYYLTAIDSSLESATSGVVQGVPSAAPKVWVSTIVVTLQSAGKNWKAVASLQVLAEGQPVEGASVLGNWLLDDAILAANVTGVTDAAGVVSMTSAPVRTTSGTFTFEVIDVLVPGYEYSPVVSKSSASLGNQ